MPTWSLKLGILLLGMPFVNWRVSKKNPLCSIGMSLVIFSRGKDNWREGLKRFIANLIW
ncbi:hypothetical protein GLYMA_01G145501v4 [Glycine max]|nr:hypothetical protein GLYMA_01G145501v4 [Glycine max]KAH1163101.1 hypothetical protein GYH30_001581 [Glycine max]